MDLDALKSLYAEASKTDEFDSHSALAKALLSSDSREVIALHYELLRDDSNRDLYLRLRAAFIKRGENGERFLLERVPDEADPGARADLLFLLGRLRSPVALDLARAALASPDSG